MSTRHDPELDDVLQDQELLRLGELLSSAVRPEPPLDDAFKSSLRRQLMHQAWAIGEGRPSLWKRAFAPPGMAWIGATAGLLLIASVVVFMATQPTSSSEVSIVCQICGSSSVALQQPILVKFNQPMNHLTTEAAVQIAPATNVTFSWQTNTLAVQPTSGNLAPNTQYQVTIGPGATTETGQHLPSAQTITFVTQPPPAPPTPSPSPTPRAPASPTSLLTGERQLAPLGGGTSSPLEWSADSSTVYFVNAKGALEVVPAKGGDVKIVAPDGVSAPVIAPAGDRLAYIRGGKVEILTFAAGTTAEVVVTPAATMVGWAKDKVVWAASDGVYAQGADKPTLLAPLPTAGDVSVLSIATDGMHGVRDVVGLCRLAQDAVHDWRDERAATDDGTAAHLVLADLLLFDVGVIRGEGDVHNQGDLWIDAVRADERATTVPRDFLLRRGRGHHARSARLLGIAAQRLEHDEGADAIVDGAGDDTVVRKIERAGIQHARIAHAEARLGLVAFRGANVHPEIRELAGVLAILGLHQVNGLLAHHAEHVAVSAEEAYALAHEHLRVPAPDGRNVDVAVVVDVLDDHADLVDMAVEHDGGRSPRVHLGHAVTGHIHRHLAGKCLGFRAPDARGGGLEARWGRCVEETLEEAERRRADHRDGALR